MGKHSYSGSELDDQNRRKKDDKRLKGDTTYTFRVNSELKAEFERLCEIDRYSAASALRRYMLRCVQKGCVTHDFNRLKTFNTRVKFRR